MLTEAGKPKYGGYDDDTKAVPHDSTTVHLERSGQVDIAFLHSSARSYHESIGHLL